MTDSALAQARALLAETPLIDAHNDLPFVIRIDKEAQGDPALYRLDERRNSGDTDIPRLREGRVAAQFWAAFIPPKEQRPASFALQQIALIKRMNELHPDVFLPAARASDVKRAHRQKKIASFITIENGAAIENRLDALDAYYDLGVRLMTLCHNATLDWVDSATDAPRSNGLSDFGRQVIARMNDLGMIVDCAHVSDDVMHQALDISRAPVVFSHSNARALCDHRRNVPDDVLARIADKGALVMATFVPDFICQRSKDWMAALKDAYGKTPEGLDNDIVVPTREKEIGAWPRGSLNQYCDHLEYLKSKVGPDHIGIGSDFFGGPQGEGLKDVSCFPHIFAELIRRGWPNTHLKKLAGENFLRVFRAVEKARLTR
ncbi:MAG: membrane dipeptidase [Methylobacteriaceae bacterium]|nr:dipeptidase [Rhodoblastus sp.]MCB9999184.1 membrane dipeptidase [Methylobacteriaceae bacterium]MCC0003168.1 membrane dipeptidase [Methylobacteriaceae bacterium]MCO5089141.1 dipeptidase [Methylobacteriaceae bacterium]HPG01981.1 dipeptidase [Rhodoblastus sp.]